MRAALLCLVFIAGCKVKNPHFEKPDAAPMKCQMSSDCTEDPDKEICEAMECVQCTSTQTDACGGMTPVCTNNTCQRCKAHVDCPSDVCMPDGSCAAAASVLYVTQNATDTTTCGKDSPCGNVVDALAVAGMKTIVRVKGTVSSTTISINNRELVFLGDPGLMGPTSVLNRTTGDIMQVTGNAKVRLYDITLSGAMGNNAITAQAAHNGELELQRCVVTGNAQGIVYQGTGTFTLSRSTVSLNLANGGIAIGPANAKFDITNSFIFRNGNSSSSNVGGVSITSSLPNGSRFEFNTIADNDIATAGAGRSAGVFCDIGGFSVANNLILRNAINDDPNPVSAQVNGTCVFTASLRQPDLGTVMFIEPNMSPFNYHLKPGSDGVDDATTGTPLMIDVDGEARPNGTARDMGADVLY